MLPDYGVGLRNFLFENTPEYEISEKIRKQVARYLNNITIVTLYVGKNNENTLIVKMVYAINGTNVKEAIELIETRVT